VQIQEAKLAYPTVPDLNSFLGQFQNLVCKSIRALFHLKSLTDSIEDAKTINTTSMDRSIMSTQMTDVQQNSPTTVPKTCEIHNVGKA
jgi:hypothetical protein